MGSCKPFAFIFLGLLWFSLALLADESLDISLQQNPYNDPQTQIGKRFKSVTAYDLLLYYTLAKKVKKQQTLNMRLLRIPSNVKKPSLLQLSSNANYTLDELIDAYYLAGDQQALATLEHFLQTEGHTLAQVMTKTISSLGLKDTFVLPSKTLEITPKDFIALLKALNHLGAGDTSQFAKRLKKPYFVVDQKLYRSRQPESGTDFLHVLSVREEAATLLSFKVDVPGQGKPVLLSSWPLTDKRYALLKDDYALNWPDKTTVPVICVRKALMNPKKRFKRYPSQKSISPRPPFIKEGWWIVSSERYKDALSASSYIQHLKNQARAYGLLLPGGFTEANKKAWRGVAGPYKSEYAAVSFCHMLLKKNVGCFVRTTYF